VQVICKMALKNVPKNAPTNALENEPKNVLKNFPTLIHPRWLQMLRGDSRNGASSVACQLEALLGPQKLASGGIWMCTSCSKHLYVHVSECTPRSYTESQPPALRC
jgi:hypothetical protein